MSEKIEKFIPTGIGGEKLKEGAEILPAIGVDNEVVWVNKKVKIPFDFKVGKRSNLGIFLTPDSKTNENKFHLEVSKLHGRSGILGRVVFEDKEGRLYRDIDIKGSGYGQDLGIGMEVVEPSIYYGDESYPGGKTLGVLDKSYAETDIDMTEKFLRANIRTYRSVALIKLKEIVDREGKRITIEEAKKLGIIKETDEPVIEIRAFGTRSRVVEIERGYYEGKFDSNDPNKQKILNDAMALIAQEQNIDPEKLTKKDYFDWFVKTIVINVARMHNRKWIHGYLTGHNITLDARIVDLDSIETLKEINERKKSGEIVEKSFSHDLETLIFTLENFGYILFELNTQDNMQTVVNEIYQNEMARLKLDKQK